MHFQALSFFASPALNQALHTIKCVVAQSHRLLFLLPCHLRYRYPADPQLAIRVVYQVSLPTMFIRLHPGGPHGPHECYTFPYWHDCAKQSHLSSGIPTSIPISILSGVPSNAPSSAPTHVASAWLTIEPSSVPSTTPHAKQIRVEVASNPTIRHGPVAPKRIKQQQAIKNEL